MKTFFEQHLEWILGVCAVVLTLVVAGVFVWGVTFLTDTISDAVQAPDETEIKKIDFNIEVAEQLDLRGLEE